MGGGILPIAAVLAHPDLDVAGEFAIGHYTHEKNPVTARAALTTLQIIEDDGLVERAARLGQGAMDRLRDRLGTLPHVRDIRGRGMMFGVEICHPDGTPDTDRAERIFYACLGEGLSFKISAGNVLTLSPPMTIPQADLDRAMDIVEQAVMQIA